MQSGSIDCAAAQAPKTELRGLPADDVHGAFNDSRLYTRYQPIVSLTDRTLLALEVLARLDHPTAGRLFPSQFVPQIEDAGMARQLTEAVIATAMDDYQTHLAPTAPNLSLNFPLDVLMAPGFPDRLEQLHARGRLTASGLILELTESQPIAHLSIAQRSTLVQVMTQLRALGYRLAIDDYGPLIPRHQHLFDLPFDLLKLDMAAVNDLSRPELIADAVATSHQQGIKVVAEGIEDQAGWQRMQDFGADYVQGFLVSRPLPARHVADWLTAWSGQPN